MIVSFCAYAMLARSISVRRTSSSERSTASSKRRVAAAEAANSDFCSATSRQTSLSTQKTQTGSLASRAKQYTGTASASAAPAAAKRRLATEPKKKPRVARPPVSSANPFEGLEFSDASGHRVTERWMGDDVVTLADLLRSGLQAVMGEFAGHGVLPDRSLGGAEVFVMPGPMERTDRVARA